MSKSETAAAIRHFGSSAPVSIIAAKVRCYEWRPFASHTDEERAAHAADIAACDAYEAHAKDIDARVEQGFADVETIIRDLGV